MCVRVGLGMREFTTSHFLTQKQKHHANFHICLMRNYYDGCMSEHSPERYVIMNIRVTKDGTFSVNHNETSVICELKILSLFFGSQFEILELKVIACRKIQNLHMSS